MATTQTYRNGSNDNGGVLLAGAVGFGLGLAASVGRKAAVHGDHGERRRLVRRAQGRTQDGDGNHRSA